MSASPRWRRSPNHDARRHGAPPDMIVLHYTDMASVEAAIGWLCAPQSKVSAHYVITSAGEVVALVEEARRAWHAGVSAWGRPEDVNAADVDINSRSIGIELDSPGHRPSAPRFPPAQMHALLDLLDAIRGRWPIPKRNVVGHSDIAPARKIDPGEAFDWRALAAAGHALWVPPSPSETPADEARLADALAACGYRPTISSFAELIAAFHRRQLPDRVGAPADEWTLGTAKTLAAQVVKEIASTGQVISPSADVRSTGPPPQGCG